MQEALDNSTNKLKTEKGVDDTDSGGSIAAASVSCGESGSGNGAEDSTITTTATTLTTKEQSQPPAKHDGITVEEHLTAQTTTGHHNTSSSSNCSNSSTSSSSSCSSGSASTAHSVTSNAFETKVKQISKNLKETTLAECATNSSATDDVTSPSSTSSSSSSSESSTPTDNSEQPTTPPPCTVIMHTSVAETDGSNEETGAEASGSNTTIGMTASSDSTTDDADQRSKKVRFHPDVKENDGGKRVIPKKKKKLKSSSASGDEAGTNQYAGGAGTGFAGADDEMELEEDDDGMEEEEEFDLARTIAEAQDYLKTHPLTFVRPQDKNAGLLQNGLLEEGDLPQLAESSEEEDFYENQPTENGIERILGKQIKCGKVEFLLRYIDRPGLFWETEDYICKQCPNLLNLYEHNRERRQERLMRHVAKRQNLRQRYTDF